MSTTLQIKDGYFSVEDCQRSLVTVKWFPSPCVSSRRIAEDNCWVSDWIASTAILHLCCGVKFWLCCMWKFLKILLNFLFSDFFFLNLAQLSLCLFKSTLLYSCSLNFWFQTTLMIADIAGIECIVLGPPVYDLVLIYRELHFIFQNAIALNYSLCEWTLPNFWKVSNLTHMNQIQIY